MTQMAKKIDSIQSLTWAIRTLVDYNWKDERDDYAACVAAPSETDNTREGHIFETIVALDNWLDDAEAEPEDHI
jgi:hypothetical protein